MSTLAHRQAALAYQAIVSIALRRQIIRDLHLQNIGRDVIERAIRNGVIQRTAERGTYFSMICDPRG
jgi:hypothetical protein